MPFVTIVREGKIRRVGDDRIVVIPKDFVLEGEDIRIVHDKWGEISLHPTSPEGLKALEKFGPFADWEDDDANG